ncbi:MAG: glycosyltransferase family 4 protein [Paludibacteraceae bacterium]|nr:glycosyltransferase family 4 protein [Paludibacteraceae bacterium]
MKIIFDNIIYSLQRYGGITVVWNELLSRARADKDLEVTELDYRQAMQPRLLERYRIPAFKADTPTLFHSSYFRILPQQGVKNITTVHDLTYHFYRHGLARAVHLWEEQRALRHSDAVICISENTKRDLLRFYPWVKEESIHVVPNGVSDIFRPMPEVEKKGYLLFVGNSTAAYKRYDVALRVAQLTGLELVTARGITLEQLNKRYNEALCLLYPSDYEGFGIPVVEAQRAGCPVIAQRWSSIPEVIGADGLMVEHASPEHMAQEMADIVRQLQSRPTEHIIRAGQKNARRFSWDNTYRLTKQVYTSLTNN